MNSDHLSAEQIRANAHANANRTPPPRLLMAMRDPGVDLIVEGARQMGATGNRRANLIAENGQRTKWPAHLMDLVDEARLHGASDESVLAFAESVAEAIRQRVYVGTGVPQEPLGDVLAQEALAEGEANRDTALLLNEPRSIGRLHQLWNSLTFHKAKLDRAQRVVAREMVRSA